MAFFYTGEINAFYLKYVGGSSGYMEFMCFGSAANAGTAAATIPDTPTSLANVVGDGAQSFSYTMQQNPLGSATSLKSGTKNSMPWTIGADTQSVDDQNLTVHLVFEETNAAAIAGYLDDGKTISSANMMIEYRPEAGSTELAKGPVTIKFPTKPAEVPDGASVLSLSTAVSLLAAASLALF